MRNIVLIGIQGSGKGTQGNLLKERYGFFHFNIGNTIRAQLNDGTSLTPDIYSIIEKGEFVPDYYAQKLLEEKTKGRRNNLVLDGFPRNLAQVEYLLSNYSIDAVIYLELLEQTAVERLLARRICLHCGEDFNIISKKPEVEEVCDICKNALTVRKDDSKERIKLRFSRFYERTYDVIKYFENSSYFYKIDSTLGREEIFQQIIKILKIDE